MALLALVVAVDAPVGLTALLAFATTAAGTAYFPAVVAMTPSLVGEDDLAAARRRPSARPSRRGCRIAGSDFLDAVNTSPIAAARLLEGVASRLAVNVA